MGKWTPTPWHVEHDSESHVLVIYGQDSTGWRIADAYDYTFVGYPARKEANARLIAAAPDLAEALEECYGYVAAIAKQLTGTNVSIPEAARRKAEAALRKAGVIK